MSRKKADELEKHWTHLSEASTKACAAWEEQNRRFAKMCLGGVDPGILELQRLDAIYAYEAMLDTIVCERGALTMVHSAAEAMKRRPGKQA